MGRVLIVSKTKMQHNHVCVGAIDLDKKKSIRLLNEDGFHETLQDCPYELLQIWDLEYEYTNYRPLPHSEDVAVLSRTFTGETINNQDLIKILHESNVPLYQGSLMSVFEDKLRFTSAGKLYISEDSCPSFSTCFWISDSLILKNEINGKVYYHYTATRFPSGFQMPYVGLEDATAQEIPQGTLLRLSLANWWAPEDSDCEERCYLQLSGGFKI